MIGLFTENGPCEVVELAAGKLGTIVRDWGWDRGSNLLYIDQVWYICSLHETQLLENIQDLKYLHHQFMTLGRFVAKTSCLRR